MTDSDLSPAATKQGVDSRRLIVGLFLVAGLMALVGVGLEVYLRFSSQTTKILVSIKDLTYPDAETNLFAWFSALVLAGIGIGFAVIAVVSRGRRSAWPFIALSATAFLLSADEAALLHERLAGFASFLGISLSWGYQWLLIGVPIAVLVGVFLLWLARSLQRVLARRLIVAGSVFLLGAIGGELLGGFIAKVDLGLSGDAKFLLHNASVLVEEGLEISGAILGLAATLAYLHVTRTPSGLVLSTVDAARSAAGDVDRSGDGAEG